MKIYFPIHLDGGNRGCEAIAKGTAEILGLPKEQLIGLCRNIELDKRLKWMIMSHCGIKNHT